MPRKKRDMVRVNIYLPTNLYKNIHLIAEETDSTAAELIRTYLSSKVNAYMAVTGLEDEQDNPEQATNAD